jgi:hypothetical protein
LPARSPLTEDAAVPLRIRPADPSERPVTPAEAAPSYRSAVVPLAPARYKVQLTISEETRDKLERVQGLVRHTIPSGDLAETFDRALTLLLQELERRRYAATGAVRSPRQTADGSRHIPAAVKRAVWRRDEGR